MQKKNVDEILEAQIKVHKLKKQTTASHEQFDAIKVEDSVYTSQNYGSTSGLKQSASRPKDGDNNVERVAKLMRSKRDQQKSTKSEPTELI